MPEEIKPSVSATAWLTAETSSYANVGDACAMITFYTGNGNVTLIGKTPDELHNALTAALLKFEAAVASHRNGGDGLAYSVPAATGPSLTPTPMNGAVAQAIVDGLPSIEADDIVQIQMLDGPTGNVIATFDTCACPDQEHHTPRCWRMRTEAGAVRAQDESQ